MDLVSGFSLTYLGLLVIAASWLLQLAYSWKGNRELRIEFIAVYTLGLAMVAVDEFVSTKGVSFMQSFSLCTAILLLARFLTFKKGK
ncbi:MAG: hypothetical protein NT067_05930 [Candidatus Diapherotrites archaeon]|nr:hypothetical protein [Candidatus Diapherotrites archaeon]